jgi:pimeloyl-ACP methyl ester carboxylesterase
LKFIKFIFVIVLSLYGIGATALYFKQESLLFNPHKLSIDHQYRDGQEIRINVDEGVDLSCIYLQKTDSKGVIIYLHGNKGNNRRCLKQAYQFNLSEYDLIMPDYRGFGKSDGLNSSEDQMLNDVQKVYDYVLMNLKPQKIIMVGYSLGSGIASYIAAKNKVDALFLVAPYTSLSDVKDLMNVPIPDFLMKYDFKTKQFLNNVKCPIVSFHAENDEVIPYQCSIILRDLYPNKITNITTPAVGHRRVIFDPIISQTFRQKLIEYKLL